ncbi:MAG TPA: potassium transporter Kup [Polyangiaceae bacterium]
MSSPPHSSSVRTRSLAIAALGVVYGDIGTSPLYAVKECFTGHHGAELTTLNVLGVISLIFWSLTAVVVVKYLTFVMQADHDGEGGILALLALATQGKSPSQRMSWVSVMAMLGLFGAALLYGDGVITPAISVLSAVEGLSVATSVFDPYIVPITVVILVVLFSAQKRGTGGIGKVFGMVMIVWFFAIGIAGLLWILKEPRIILAVNPMYAVRFLTQHGMHGFLVLGAVVLCITGGEALYADMGHFGRLPIRIAWYAIVFPALILNYFGQGALLLAKGASVVENPFYALVPASALYPMVGVATLATVIASQALISGSFSLTHQAVQLGYLPRFNVVHTASHTEGQIYIPTVRTLMMLGSVALVLGFRASSNLAAAYGIAVTGTMGITTVLFFEVMKNRWGTFLALSLSLVFLTIDLAFFASNIAKIPQGGWVSIGLAVLIFVVMITWRRGRLALRDRIRAAVLPIELFLDDVSRSTVTRVSGTAVFLSLNPNVVPAAMLHNFKHNKVLHQTIIMLNISMDRVPEVAAEDRVETVDFGQGFYQVVAHYGFMQRPNVPDILQRCAERGVDVGADISYYLSRETLVLTGRSGMARWRKVLFAFLSRNAHSVTDFFSIPPGRVIELGMQVEI